MAKELGKEIFINQSKALAARKNYKEILKKIKFSKYNWKRTW